MSIDKSKLASGVKVKCVDVVGSNNLSGHGRLITIGEVYTIDTTFRGGDCITLVEINKSHPEGPFMDSDDFEIWTEDDCSPTDSDAYDRAMSIL